MTYPAAIDSTATLYVNEEFYPTTLASSATNSQNTLVLTDATGYPTVGGQVIIDDGAMGAGTIELATFTAISDNTLTGVTRGFNANYPGIAHAAGKRVRFTMGISKTLLLQSALVATQDTLGINPQGTYPTVKARLDDAGASLASHIAAADPHTQYMTAAEDAAAMTAAQGSGNNFDADKVDGVHATDLRKLTGVYADVDANASPLATSMILSQDFLELESGFENHAIQFHPKGFFGRTVDVQNSAYHYKYMVGFPYGSFYHGAIQRYHNGFASYPGTKLTIKGRYDGINTTLDNYSDYYRFGFGFIGREIYKENINSHHLLNDNEVNRDDWPAWGAIMDGAGVMKKWNNAFAIDGDASLTDGGITIASQAGPVVFEMVMENPTPWTGPGSIKVTLKAGPTYAGMVTLMNQAAPAGSTTEANWMPALYPWFGVAGREACISNLTYKLERL